MGIPTAILAPERPLITSLLVWEFGSEELVASIAIKTWHRLSKAKQAYASTINA